MTHTKQVARYKDYLAKRKEGWSFQKIADKYGISRQAVYERIQKGEPKGRGRNLH